MVSIAAASLNFGSYVVKLPESSIDCFYDFSVQSVEIDVIFFVFIIAFIDLSWQNK